MDFMSGRQTQTASDALTINATHRELLKITLCKLLKTMIRWPRHTF